MSGLSFALTDEQRQLRDSFARFMQREYAFEQRSETLNDSGQALTVWRRMIDQGYFHLAVSEELGGIADADCALENLALLGEEMGAGLMAQPVVRGGAFVARLISALVESGLTPAAGQALLEPLLSGSGPVYLCPLLAADNTHSQWLGASVGDFTRALSKDCDKVQGAINFSVTQLPCLMGSASAQSEAAECGTLVLLVPGGEHCTLTMIALDDPRLSGEHYRLLDDSWAMDVQGESVVLDADHRLDSAILTEALHRADAASGTVECAFALGTMSKMVEDSRDYLLLRKQFGKPLAEFQALQHRIADMAVAREMARAHLHRSLCFSRRSALDFLEAERACRVQTAKSAVLIGRGAIQLHGAIGLSEEHHIAHYYRSLLVFAQGSKGLQGALAECRDALLNRATTPVANLPSQPSHAQKYRSNCHDS